MIRHWVAAWTMAVAAPMTLGASAADLVPPPDMIEAAAAAGAAAAANRDGGYRVADHVIYAVRDARDIDPADGDVDAVMIATPLERTRHAAFIATYTGQPIPATEAYRAARLPPGHLAVIVYAHGADAEDETFIGQFGPARLSFDGESIAALSAEHSEPSVSLYPLAEGDRQRMVATLTYRFDLSRVANAGQRRARLVFTDPTGKSFDLPFDLAKLQ